MRRRVPTLVILAAGALLFSLPAAAQVYYPGSAEQRKAAETAKPPKYDVHDLSGIWRGAGPSLPPPKDPKVGDAHASPLLGGVQPPPMTPWGQELFNSRKPSAAEVLAIAEGGSGPGQRSAGALRSFGLPAKPLRCVRVCSDALRNRAGF